MKISEYNCETGEEIIRDATSDEIAQAKNDAEQRKTQTQAEINAQVKRDEALSKLVALGLTADDLKALGL